MNIGIFTDTYEPQINGVVTSIQTSIEYLEKNHSIYVFCPNVKPKVASTDTVWRFPSVVYPFQKEYRLVLPFNKKLKRIKDLNLDILHIHTPFTMGNIGIKVAQKLNIPMIHTYHTFFEKYLHYFPILPESWVYKYAKKESEKFCNQCDKIIVPTDEMRDQLSKYDIKKELITIPSGINVYEPSNQEVVSFRKAFMRESKLNCLFVGRIGLEKNIYFLIRAFSEIIRNVQNCHLTLIGDGPERATVEKKVASMGLSNNVTFTGYLDKKQVFSAYHAADLMLFPSKTETQGLTAVESIMCGTPVIGLNEMGVKNVVDNNASGILTNESVSEYASAAIELLQNETLRKQMSRQAALLGQKYSYLSTNKKLEDLYKEVMTNTPPATNPSP
jgi:1,2-diacylglycerol 3-alpha-glucosyltransferase